MPFAAAVLAASLAADHPDPLADCRAAHADEPRAHVACLEAAWRERDTAQRRRTGDATAATAERTSGAPAPADAAAPTRASTPAPPQSSPPPAGPVTVPTPARAAAPPAELGAEQVRVRERRDANAAADERVERVAVEIVSVAYDATGRGTFRLGNGQTWRETTPSPERARLAPGREYTGHIERAALGGYRLYVDGLRWMVRVQRIE